MKSIVIAILLFNFQFLCSAIADAESSKTDSQQVVEALNQLRMIAETEMGTDNLELTSSTKKKIEASLTSIQASYVLAKLAISCRSLAYERSVGEDPDSAVYDWAYWKCVEIVASMEGEDKDGAIHILSQFSGLQSGDLQRFKEITKSNQPN